MPTEQMTTRFKLSDRAAIAKLITRTATLANINASVGEPSVRFCVISCMRGIDTDTEATSIDVAKALGLKTFDIRLARMSKDDLAVSAPLHETLRRTLETFGDAFILCSDAALEPDSPLRTKSSTVRPALRETIEFLAAQDVDRDNVRRARIVLLTTSGPAADVVKVVCQVTNMARAGVLVLK